MKHLFLLFAVLVCSPLLAQNPAKLPSCMLSPKHELELRQHLAEQQRKSQLQSAMPQTERRMPQFKAQNDGSAFLRDSTVCFTENKRDSKIVYTYDESGRVTSEVQYNYSTGVIWEGEQSCYGWDAVSLRFSDYEGYLPTLSDDTYETMVGKTMHLDIKAVAGEGTTIRVMDGWRSQIYVPDTPVKAGETFSFDFTQEMADNMKKGGKGKDLTFVSNNGLTITKFYFDDDYNEKPSIKKEYKYDALGNYAGYIGYNWNNNDWVQEVGLSNYNETLYDENGRVIGFASPYLSEKREYLTDSDGKEIGYIRYVSVSDNGEWTILHKIEYTFDANDDVTGSMVYTPTDGEWVLIAKYESIFDAKGRDIASVEYVLTDGEWVNNYKYEYAYDDNDHETLHASYIWQEGKWVGYYKYEYAYDYNNHETLHASYNWQDGKWVGASKNEYAYDEHGNPTYSAWFYGLDDEWILSTEQRFENTYDANGFLTDVVFSYFVIGGEMLASSKSVYNYDANGNMICQISYSMQDGEWKESHKSEYTYDENGNQTRSVSFVKTYDGWKATRTEIHYYTLHHTTAIEQVKAESRNAPRKVIKDGKILIMKDGRVYNVEGQQVEMK